jgi:hypothetical protein
MSAALRSNLPWRARGDVSSRPCIPRRWRNEVPGHDGFDELSLDEIRSGLSLDALGAPRRSSLELWPV